MDGAVQRVAVLIAFMCICVSLGWYMYKNIQPKSQYTIGLMQLSSRIFHERVNSRLKELISLDKRFRMIEFTSPSLDQILLNSVANAALDSSADILIVIGQFSSQTLVKLSQKRNILKPIVFLGVLDPVNLGLVDSIERPGHNATGFFAESPVQSVDQIALARLIKPNVSRILIPFGVGENSHESCIKLMQESTIGTGITLTLLPIDVLSETMNRVSSKIAGHDMVMYLEADAIGSYGIGMGKLASQQKCTMFAGSPEGIAGAAVSYAPDSRMLADYAFNVVKRIVINNESPSAISVKSTDGNRTLNINTKLCAEQDLKDIDIERILRTINTDPRFEPVRGHVVVQ